MDLTGMGHRLFEDRAIGPVVETLFSLFLDHTPLCFDTYGVYLQLQHPFRFKPHHKFSPHTKALWHATSWPRGMNTTFQALWPSERFYI